MDTKNLSSYGDTESRNASYRINKIKGLVIFLGLMAFYLFALGIS